MDQHSSGQAGAPVTETVLSPPQEQFFDAFLGAAAAVRRRVSADLVQLYNITLSDYQTLRHLAGAPDRRMRLQDLADARFLSRSRISRMIYSFESRGFIERERPEDDRRGWYAILTPAGQDWLDRCEPTYASSVHRHALGTLGPDTIRIVTAAAQQLASPVPPGQPEPARAKVRLH
ncbi:MarR family winged helix-turn-helix transcriptional regulator [Actinoplanes sp. M2I2]|uniref:MarR family winged helix-turn-helix transcriptional regulator n=1 Tax=Actinoplanes sp. M2I2 TaxID=1734444 RepID=UPI002021FAFD|nr:MarR family winged helix-turn-helix transcriptional regulator [Actinoplanes sp. M2I2]